MNRIELRQVVRELREYDHLILGPEDARRLSEPFGFKATTHLIKADPGDPKGALFSDGSLEKEGIDAADLAAQICAHVGVSTPSLFGRGARLRAACDALDRWLNGGTVDPEKFGGAKTLRFCVLCGNTFTGFGHNAQPLKDGRCCDACNTNRVVPERINRMFGRR